MAQKNISGIAMKSVAGALIGSMYALLASKKGRNFVDNLKTHTKDWTEKAKDSTESIIKDVKKWTQPPNQKSPTEFFLKGIMLGVLLGAGSTALLTPKTGRQVRKDLTDAYDDLVYKNGMKKPRKLKSTIRTALKAASTTKKAVRKKIKKISRSKRK